MNKYRVIMLVEVEVSADTEKDAIAKASMSTGLWDDWNLADTVAGPEATLIDAGGRE